MATNSVESHQALLYQEHFDELIQGFSRWRMSTFIRQLESSKSKGRVLPFVRGLRLSAQLVYVTREVLSGSGLTANWGHILDKDGTLCSRECDVIIHNEGHIRRWNGSERPIMDFRFIEQKKAVAVISCKSFITSGRIEKGYCDDMKQYVKRVWLFAECCGPKSADFLRQKALTFGYEKFWFLYTWSEASGMSLNLEDWLNFVNEIKKLCK